MEKVLRNRFFYSFVALLFALLLFFNANSDNNNRVTQSAQKFDTTVYDVPVQVDYDESTYYVSGFQPTVTVHLSSINRVKLAQETNKETRTFKVVADLKKQKEGTVDVVLRTVNLTSGVEAVIDPAVISATVEKKVTETMKVNPILNDDVIKEGYEVENIEVNPSEVTVTTGKETFQQIASIQAKLNSKRSTMTDYKEEVLLQAVDSNGNVLPATLKPDRVSVSVSVKAPKRKVGLTFKEVGSLPASVEKVILQGKEESVTAIGPQSLLDQLGTIEVPVNVSGIEKQQTVTVAIPAIQKGVTFNPAKMEVTVIPVLKKETKDSQEKTEEKESAPAKESSSSETTEKTTSESTEVSSSVTSESRN